MATFIGIDLGASNTRFVADNGKVYEVENNIKEIDIDEQIRIKPWSAETYEDIVLGSLDIEIERIGGGTPHIKPRARYLVGKLATRLGASSTPNGLQNKAAQSINYTNAILATALSKLFMSLDNANPVPYNTKLFVALPPVELSAKSTSENQMQSELIGEYKVTFKADIQKEVRFEISSVSCIEESFLTLISFFFTTSGGFREEAKNYLQGNVLGIDIGASTTDLAVVKDVKFVEKSGQTYKIGGNLVLDLIADDIRAKYGYDPERDELQKAVETGFIDQGSNTIDISHLVVAAKKEFAIKLVDMMQGYFTKIAMQPHTFKAVVIGGGGSMKSAYKDMAGHEVETSEPMSTYIWEEFKKICPSVPVVQVNAEPRHANINGLYIRALVDKLNAQRKGIMDNNLRDHLTVNDVDTTPQGKTEMQFNFGAN